MAIVNGSIFVGCKNRRKTTNMCRIHMQWTKHRQYYFSTFLHLNRTDTNRYWFGSSTGKPIKIPALQGTRVRFQDT